MRHDEKYPQSKIWRDLLTPHRGQRAVNHNAVSGSAQPLWRPTPRWTETSVKCCCCLSHRGLTGFPQHGEWIEEVLLPSWRTFCCLLCASDYFARSFVLFFFAFLDNSLRCSFNFHFFLKRPRLFQATSLDFRRKLALNRRRLMWQTTEHETNFHISHVAVHICLTSLV